MPGDGADDEGVGAARRKTLFLGSIAWAIVPCARRENPEPRNSRPLAQAFSLGWLFYYAPSDLYRLFTVFFLIVLQSLVRTHAPMSLFPGDGQARVTFTVKCETEMFDSLFVSGAGEEMGEKKILSPKEPLEGHSCFCPGWAMGVWYPAASSVPPRRAAQIVRAGSGGGGGSLGGSPHLCRERSGDGDRQPTDAEQRQGGACRTSTTAKPFLRSTRHSARVPHQSI